MATRFIEPFDFKTIFVDIFLGTPLLFPFVFIIAFSYISAHLGLPNRIYLILLGLGSLMFAAYMGQAIYILVLFLIGFILYSLLEGWREANADYCKEQLPETHWFRLINQHPYYMVQRGIVIFLIGLYNWWLMIPMVLIFSYFHNGMYFCRRNLLDDTIYKLRWKDEGTGGWQKMDFNYDTRFFMAIIGLCIYFLILIYYI